ncbi:MAG: helix-turn-helix domain-containing protein [Anaerolineales bacterium]|nr:MAG: helix-turn-helix domain-containing protein [Anaerolineales bacterium]
MNFLSSNKPMPDINEFYSTEQAANVLGFTVASVRQLVYKKKIESRRFGRSLLIPKKSIKEYLEKTRGMSKNDPRRRIK